MLTVRDPRSGMPVRAESWAAWRARWDRRPLPLRRRLAMCPWCWGFGGLVLMGADAIGLPCLACGRVGTSVPAPRHRPETCPTCGGHL